MPRGARTPEELESLIEDACVVGDHSALGDLLDDAAVVRTGDGTVGRGRHAAYRLRARAAADDACYCADPRVVLQSADLALVVSPDSINVVRRGSDHCWRLVISLLDR